MHNYKILILLPDGVGLRNFVYSDFQKVANAHDIDIVYWNTTKFDNKNKYLKSIKLSGKPHFKTDLYKRARKKIEINQFCKLFYNSIYKLYLFQKKPKNFKEFIKQEWTNLLSKKYKNNLSKLRNKITIQERKTDYYKNCINLLLNEKPSLVFCSNQRALNAIAPMIAAQDLGILTANFIFSWDNIPKATMVVEADYYFVWSDYMAKQIVQYYPYIKKKQIKVTGSPQFQLHQNKVLKLSKKEFLKQYQIPQEKKYICFSGDDITTSPHDPEYLDDICSAVRQINNSGFHYAVLFRPCPVDHSNRYDDVLKKNSDIVYCLRPLWKKNGKYWDTVIPTPEDQSLLYNTITHSEIVINLGSSMVFDAACHHKPCAYIRYNPSTDKLKKDVHSIYNYIHFQSMPQNDAVVWLDSKEKLADTILYAIQNPEGYVKQAKTWFSTINLGPYTHASERIIKSLKSIINQ